MKKNVFLLFVLFAGTLTFTSCVSEWFGITGNGSKVTETRTATDFQSVQLLTSANVTIVKDTAYKIEVEDYENIVKYFSVKVVSHNLVISLDPVSTILLNSVAKVKISMPDSLIGLTIAGSGTINVDSAFKDVKTLVITGSGNIRFNKNLSLNALNASIMGSGNITAGGTAKSLTCITTGSGNMGFSGLVCPDINCNISGSGNQYVNGNGTLKVTITGSGYVKYLGSPTITKTITGSGDVMVNNQ